MKKSIILLLFAFNVSGCVTSPKDIMSGYSQPSKGDQELQNDFKACEVDAYNAGHTRRGGLLTEGPRTEYISGCLEKKGWSK
ncbi:MAG: hypothetical protein H6625_00265 [Bdellovibrionaceae bacterium]|nr:hypothetical protein [Pseudobdellovibrionaceae bacterium]